MKSNFEACMAHIFASEGGYVDYPSDPGGATNMGITIGTLSQWRGRKVTKADVKSLTKDEAMRIYAAKYWKPVQGDDLPDGLDLVAFDAAVNSGPSRGAKWLQQALGVTVDGKIGPQTIAAAQATYAPAAIQRAVGFRLAFLRSLKTWPTFGKGWTARMQRLEASALAMADHKPVAKLITPKPVDDSIPPKSDPQAFGLAWLIKFIWQGLVLLIGGRK